MRTIRDYAESIIINKKKIIVATVLSMLLAGLISLFLPDIYVAQAVVVMHYPQKSRLATFVMSQSSTPGQDFDLPTLSVKNCVNLLMSPEVMQKVIDRLELNKKARGGFTVKKLKKILKIDLVKERSYITDVIYAPAINLLVNSPNRKLAKDIANCWAEVLIDKAAEIDKNSLNNVFTLAEEYQAKLRDRIEAQERLISGIPRNRNMTSEEKEVKLSHIKRELEELKQRYTLNSEYLNNINILMIQRGALRVSIAVRAIEPAKEDKVFPNRAMIALLSGFLALSFSCFWFSFQGVASRQ